ncbi:MAG: hypothetical protein ACOYD1_07755 [Candidatus Nanopelagicales bacterium]
MATEAWRRCQGDGQAADVIRPKFFLPVPGFLVSAVQINGLNRIGLISWINDSPGPNRAAIAKSGIALLSAPHSYPRTAVIGDWLLCAGREFCCVPDVVFRALYAEAGDEE